MDMIAAYNDVGSYRGAAAICGVGSWESTSSLRYLIRPSGCFPPSLIKRSASTRDDSGGFGNAAGGR